MGNAIDLAARALWLSMRNEGGWWSVPGLTHHWRPSLQEVEVENHLASLARLGFIESRTEARHSVAYAVTPNCQPLPGYQLTRERRST